MDRTRGYKSERIAVEILNQEHWEKAYERLEEKNLNGFDSLYAIKEAKELVVDQLMGGTYKWSTPKKVEIAKVGTTKKRVVYIYSEKDRYILGVLNRAFGEVYKEEISPNCYSYKRGKNTADAIKDISRVDFTTKKAVKMDISAYFNSVSREHLYRCIDEVCEKGTGIHRTLSAIYKNDRVEYKGKQIEEYKSLIPGCALGSFFANYCLKEIDEYFREKGKIYARYSDDIILFGETDEEIAEGVAEMKQKIADYGLTINPKKYEYYEPGEVIEYLGLGLSNQGIDISRHGKEKMKRTIKRWVVKARREMELEGKSYTEVATKLIKRFNYKLYKCYIEDARKFGWGYYAFRYITLTESLVEIDFYMRDRLRYLKTGKNNKANIKSVSDEQLEQMGLLSTYEMYKLFRYDFEYYCEVVGNI